MTAEEGEEVALKVGDQVPDFEAKLSTGETKKLSDLLAAGPVVLFFYPKAFTPGCTAESCHFRDLQAEFKALNATPIGISSDSVDDQQKFATHYSLPFPLIADEDGSIAKIFGAKRPALPFDRRMTFVISPGQKIIESIKSEVNMDTHADTALAALRGTGEAPSSVTLPDLETNPTTD
jgi:thioredoxin-dependent peroxiredoxin